MAKKKETNDEAMMVGVNIPQIDIGLITVKIVGESPLIVHKWSEKARREMLDKQMKKASAGKDAKNPAKDFVDSLYFLDDAGNLIDTPSELDDVTENTPYEVIEDVFKRSKFGFPTCAFKACAIDAGYQQGALGKKTTARGAFHIVGEYAVIEGMPTMREDMVQIGGMSRVADIRFRPEFKEWRTSLCIRYNKKAISPEQIINILALGGFSNGIGEWRPSKNGSFGTFHCE